VNPNRLIEHTALVAAATGDQAIPPAAVALWYRDGALAVAPIDDLARFFDPRGAAPVLYVGHSLDGGALLYLPEGESVEQRHLDDVERWLAEHPGHDGAPPGERA
jgi:hypothetical protein